MPGLMQGKRGLIMGVANDHSIAWGIAKTLAAHDAKLAFTFQGDALGKRVKPLAESVVADLVLPCDVEDIASVDKVFAEIGRTWGTLDFLVHAIAFSDKTQLTGRFADTTRENFLHTMLLSLIHISWRSPLANKIQPSAMRCRVGRKPTSRSFALTSCHGHPVRSARPCWIVAGAAPGTIGRAVKTGRDSVIAAPTAFAADKIVASEIIIRHPAPAATAPPLGSRSASRQAGTAPGVRLCRIPPIC